MLKKEARILGLSATAAKRHETLVIGVVFRGGFWLDGILTCSLEPRGHDNTSRISRAIMKSRQYSQLHAVFLSREHIAPGLDIDTADLARRLKLPVIALVKKWRGRNKKRDNASKTNHYSLVISGKRVAVLACRIGAERLREIFAAASARDHPIPEALRVADLIAKQATLKWNSLGLA